MASKLFSVKNEADAEAASIYLYGPIGPEYQDGIIAADVRGALEAIPAGRQINVHINSPGGNLWEALPMTIMISERAPMVTCFNDGLCASAATLLAIAGHKTVAHQGSLFMIHNTHVSASGDAKTLEAEAVKLRKHDEIIVGMYHRKTGQSESAIATAMDAETWMGADEAHAFGFIDEVLDGQAPVALACGFDWSLFKNVPQDRLRRIIGGAFERSGQGEDEAEIVRAQLNRIAEMDREIATIDRQTLAYLEQSERWRKANPRWAEGIVDCPWEYCV